MTQTPEASSLLAALPIKKRKGRHCVYVGRLADDFQPQSDVDLPDQLGDVKILERPLTMAQAIALVRHFNDGQLDNGIPDSKWAVIGFQPKGGAQ